MNNREQHDLILWQAVKNGSQEAFDDLYHQYVQVLFKYGLSLGANKESIKDHIQELFTSLWRKRNQLHIEKSFKNYLLLSFRRSLFSKKEKLQTIEINEEKHDLRENFSHGFSETSILQTEKSQKIKTALQFLPKRQREAIFLKYYQNLDYEEIAKTMGIQVPAVYKLVSVGIKKLREML